MMMLRDNRQQRVREGRAQNKLENKSFFFFGMDCPFDQGMLPFEVEFLGDFIQNLSSTE